MIPLKNALSSTVGRKFLMGLTGLALVGFVITHLLGNLSLYLADGTTFNKYALALHGWGWLLIVAELGLLGLFLLHILTGILVTKTNKDARPNAYYKAQTKGGPSKSGFASRNMIVTGLFLTLFLIIHVKGFRFGPGMAEGYVQDIQGHQARDLHRLVVETFRNPAYVGFYVVAMLVLWAHLKHGFWSAFQSLGANNPRLTGPISVAGHLIAFILAAGFLFIPVWIYFTSSGALQ